MMDANWCIPSSGHLKMPYTIMTNADWCIPPCGAFNNAIHHHEGCRLVHPAMRDIEQFRFAFMTDAAWCIPPCWSFGISIQFKISRIDQFVYNLINHSHAINCQTFQISHFQIQMHFRNNILEIYIFHTIISDLFGKLPKQLKSENDYGGQGLTILESE